MKIYIETSRLILREILDSDLNNLFELDSNPEVHKYLGNKPVNDRKQIEQVINSIRKQYVENGIGRWAIIEKSNNQFIGWSGLKLVTENVNNQTNYYDIGYRLIRKFWGNGFASESAIASLKYGFENLQIKEIYAAAHIDNIASNKILINIGLKFIETFSYDNSIHNWYKLKYNEWKETRK